MVLNKKLDFIICLILAGCSILLYTDIVSARRSRLADTASISEDHFTLAGNEVHLTVSGGKVVVGTLDKPGMIFGQTLPRWTYVHRILNLRIQVAFSMESLAVDFYQYVRESHSAVEQDIKQEAIRLINMMGTKSRTIVRGIKEVEEKIENWCRRNNVTLPGGWEENKGKKAMSRRRYLIAQIINWFAIACHEDDKRVEYRFVFVDDSDLRERVRSRIQQLLKCMGTSEKPDIDGIIQIEKLIEDWCEEKIVARLPKGWQRNKRRKVKDRRTYLVKEIIKWFATASVSIDELVTIGRRFWTLPIWPVTEEGDLNIELVEWMFEDKGFPPADYITAEKVPLTHFIDLDSPLQLPLPFR